MKNNRDNFHDITRHQRNCKKKCQSCLYMSAKDIYLHITAKLIQSRVFIYWHRCLPVGVCAHMYIHTHTGKHTYERIANLKLSSFGW